MKPLSLLILLSLSSCADPPLRHMTPAEEAAFEKSQVPPGQQVMTDETYRAMFWALP